MKIYEILTNHSRKIRFKVCRACRVNCRVGIWHVDAVTIVGVPWKGIDLRTIKI